MKSKQKLIRLLYIVIILVIFANVNYDLINNPKDKISNYKIEDMKRPEAFMYENINKENSNTFSGELKTSASSWTRTKVVSTESTDISDFSSIAVDGFGNVHMVWCDATNYASSGADTDIFYKHWNAATCLWSTTEVISTESTGGSVYPTIAVDNLGSVYVAWQDSSDYAGSGGDVDIFYKHWNITTSLWSATEVVSTESTDISYYASIAVDNSMNVHVVWYDLTNYGGSGLDYDIFYKCWNMSKGVWLTTEVISTESTDGSHDPKVAVDNSGNVHVVWHDYTDYAGEGADTDIFYKRLNATTGIWTTTDVISTESTDVSRDISIAIDNSENVHLVWQDYTDYAGAETDKDIFYKRWNITTDLWSTTEIVSTESTGNSSLPTVATDGSGNVHVAWDDYTDYEGSGTDQDIFYKKTRVLSLAFPPDDDNGDTSDSKTRVDIALILVTIAVFAVVLMLLLGTFIKRKKTKSIIPEMKSQEWEMMESNKTTSMREQIEDKAIEHGIDYVEEPKKSPKPEKAREFIPIVDITEEEKEELEKIESEIDIKGLDVICVVHKGPIDGPIYLCPSCRTFYCQKCAMALKEKRENCWVCDRKFEL